MSKLNWKGGALLAPLPPVMVSCGTMDSPNIITIAWTGIVNTKPAKTYISIRPSRYSYDIIKDSGEFVLNLTTTKLVAHADFCGVRSGRDVDKFKHCGLTPEPSTKISAPMICESPLSIECKLSQIIPMGGTHDMFLADILAVNVDEKFLDSNGRLMLESCGLACFAHGEYFEVGKKIGSFGFSVHKKTKGSKKSHTSKNRKILKHE